MFTEKTIWQIFNMGGFTMYILLFCSLLSVAVMLERFVTFTRKAKVKRTDLMARIHQALEQNSVADAVQVCVAGDSPLSNVVHAGLKVSGHEERAISNAMDREIIIETIRLEKLTSVVGTIGNIAVYIGLFGTVIGIVRAFHDISVSGSGGMSVVIGGVAEALICTATGLLVAIPAVIGYNYFTRRVDTFVNEMELCASETLDLLAVRKKDER